ncbi:unnamed protein product [Zymoseptoria tritici ST99CH_1A5]|uniref:Alpha/beta hydrolase fold-3 domain-containing protein n=2 Tax=Zymoseptoria tritici TaxID=1047171 RepID=A0A2H1G458_ZYMTR|nr:unnamed protein product [Zymoseptoria tritici ST99CH_1E4]SMR49426.1 unnamed protein product [Zymoseptoria tritici ST99CH_3D1]SMY22124.1 unnamed protein product [Zymoseptoria tritici ST99CH_1A5]
MSAFECIQFACIRTIVNASLAIRRDFIQAESSYLGGHVAEEDTIFPLVVCAHNGVFLLNNPSLDDPLTRHLADASRSVVVSIDYRKAPQNKFPGGNLVLAAAQNPQIRDRLTGIIAVYPICDLVPSFGEKMASRSDPSVPDFLGSTCPGISDLYLGQNANVELTDVRLSPTHFKSRSHLPQNALMVACEHDLLRQEAEGMAERLATLEGSSKVAAKNGWRAGCIEWYLVEGQPHAFEIFPAKTPEKEAARKAAETALYSDE